MQSTLFRNVFLLDPDSPHHKEKVDIQIDGEGLISGIGKLQANSHHHIVEWPEGDVYVSPGWIDMEVHLNAPGHEYKETLEELDLAAAKGGFTSILCYPNTQPSVENASLVDSLRAQTQRFPVNFLFTGSVSEGNMGEELAELYSMQEAGALAFTEGPDMPIKEDLLAKALRYASAFDGLIINYPLLDSLAKGGQVNEGMISLQLGMVPLPEAAETAALLRDIEIFRHEGGRFHIQPVSSPRVLDILAERKKGMPNLSVGMPVYYFSFNDEDLLEFDTNLKVIPPLRSKSQITEIREHLKSGTIDVLSSGHRAQGLEEKRLEFALADPGMLNLQTFLPTVVAELIDPGVLSWEKALRYFVERPRELLGIEVPRIKTGSRAELTFFSPDHSWALTEKDIPSRAKNSPFIGKPLKGKSMGIYSKGQWVPAI